MKLRLRLAIAGAAIPRRRTAGSHLVLSADPARRRVPYDGAVVAWYRSFASEPRVARPPAPGRRDWALVGAVECVAVVEVLARSDLPWRWVSFAVGVAVLPVLVWRRTHPLAMTVIAFTMMAAFAAGDLLAGLDQPPGLYAMAPLILTLYALCRWGSGRQIMVGAPFALATGTICIVADYSTLSDAVGGYAALDVVIAVGLAVRFRSRARQRELDNVRMREREDLARDLHDTVAHHVSAIVIRAQAGIAVSPARDDAAIDALRVIEAEATKTLAEMRAMVAVLRRDGAADLAPTPTLEDIYSLGGGGETPAIAVSVTGDVDDVDPAVATAVYKLAQESVTNARRHARRASQVAVRVSGQGDRLTLRVADDGERVNGERNGEGFGIAGMSERASVLGGTCVAGPGPERGWVVTAELPKKLAPT